MAPTKTWADGPFKLISTPRAALKGAPETPASRNASEMALVHNVMFRGLNAIYLQAPNVKKKEDVQDLLNFCDAFSAVLRAHHTTEETVYFPLLEEQASTKGVMEKNHAEHELFLPGLLKFDLYVAGVREGKEEYDGATLRGLIDEFGPSLESHLRAEIELLLELGRDEKIDWGWTGKAMAAHSKKTADRIKEVPFIITNSDVTYEGGVHGPRFPPFPWFVSQIFRWVYIPKLKGAWRFSSCDDYGKPRELPFV